jgi:membrane fusion protein, multidrug efflux system
MRAALWTATTLVAIGAGAALVAPQALRQLEASAAAPADAAAPPPRTVLVTTARLDPGRAERRLPGIVDARTEADLAFRVGGKVLARQVSVGDAVKAGDVVATLDDTDLRLQLEAAEAERAAARIALEKAEINLDRVATLKAKGWATGQASDLETVAVEESRARLLEAGRNVDLARNVLSYATLRVEADGVVTATMAEPGQVLTAGQPVARLAHAGEREAVVAIPEAMLAGVRDAVARVELWSEPGRPIAAELRQLSPVADEATRTFEARYTLAADDAAAALGMSVTLSLAGPAAGRGVELPVSALLDTGAGPAVWVVGADGRLAGRPVTISDFEGGSARISAGLAEGDRVVVLGAHKLGAGEPVRPVEAGGG